MKLLGWEGICEAMELMSSHITALVLIARLGIIILQREITIPTLAKPAQWIRGHLEVIAPIVIVGNDHNKKPQRMRFFIIVKSQNSWYN